jgi:hypothetical protein
MPSLCFGTLPEHGPGYAGKGLGFRYLDHFDLAATFLAPESSRPSAPDDQEPIGFDGNFGPFSANHGFHQTL